MTIPLLVRRAAWAAVAGAALCATPLARADLVTGGFANGYETFSVTAPAANNVPTGGFTGVWDGTPIIFFCFELTQYFSPGTTYTDYTASNPSSPQFMLLGELFTEAFAHATDTPDNSAAFQLAIWEILYENTTPTDLRSGGFHVLSDNGHTLTVNQANFLLTHLPSTSTYTITELYSREHQNFIFGTPTSHETPEPSPLPLLGIGLGAIVLVAARRRALRRRA
jgi:hypothetical protein